MKKSVKILMIILVVAIIICLIPVRIVYKDSGSVEYKAIAYSITRYNIIDPESESGRFNGWRIELLGHVFKDDNES